MAYSKNTWATGDVITAEKLNSIENAVGNVSSSVDSMAPSVAKIDNIEDSIGDINSEISSMAPTLAKVNPLESAVQSLSSEIASARNYNSAGTANTLGGRIDELVRISNTQPGGNNEIWVNSGNGVVETEVPTYQEFNNLIVNQNTQPSAASNRIWIPTSGGEEVEVPEMEEFNDLKNMVNVKTNYTPYIISVNGNYLNYSDINMPGKYFHTPTGRLVESNNFSCGYIRFPCAGEYKLYSSQNTFGINRFHVPLFRADKTYYKSIFGEAIDDNIIKFTLSEDDAQNATYIGVSTRPNSEVHPMLILNKDYPSDYSYVAPKYDFSDFENMRYMGKAPIDLDTLVLGGWYSNISKSTHTTLPLNYIGTAGMIMVFPYGPNPEYAMQILCSPTTPIIIWTRYVKMDGTNYTKWSEIFTRVDNTLSIPNMPANAATVGNKITELKSYINNAQLIDKNISLSGNYFDYKNADWQVGYDTGTSILQTSGYHYAFVKLLGPGTYIRVMRNTTFGTNAARVALYDKNKTYIKYVNATRIESTDGFSFELTTDDAMSAVYTTISYRDTYPYVVGLFYESDAYPLKVGLQAALPNYKSVSDPLYKCTFICDGDSICQAATDQPKYARGWWGRIVLDYSADGKNYGVGGGTITSGLYYDNGNPRHWVNESIDTIYSEYPALDYLILEGGTNDADLIGKFNEDTAPAKFGTWSETDFSGNYNNTTFCGAVETMFYKALNYWPKAKIGFIIAMQMGTANTSSSNRRRYFDEIKAIAKKWHIPVLDLWNESQMDARLTAYYDPSISYSDNVAAEKCYYDGQHPTSYGYDLMQGKIDAWIHTL